MTNQQVHERGKRAVADEIHRRGGTVSSQAKRLQASSADGSRTVTIVEVHAKTSGDWQTTIKKGRRCGKPTETAETQFWVLVDLGHQMPVFYVIPAWWMQNDIYETHNKWLDQFPDRQRPRSPDSTHTAIGEERVDQWLGRWESLGIF